MLGKGLNFMNCTNCYCIRSCVSVSVSVSVNVSVNVNVSVSVRELLVISAC